MSPRETIEKEKIVFKRDFTSGYYQGYIQDQSSDNTLKHWPYIEKDLDKPATIMTWLYEPDRKFVKNMNSWTRVIINI